MAYDYHKSTWLNPNIEYIFNDEIIEYDIRDAGFSLIKQHHLLPDEKIRGLEKLGKGDERHIAIGKLQRDDKQLALALTEKFAEIRMIFINSNELTDNDIVSVKKDAIYTIGTCNRLKFDMVHFIPKNQYSSYIRFANIQNLEVYYNSDKIDIKGMGDGAVNRHRLYMMQFFNTIIPLIESHNPRAKRFIIKFIDDYKYHKLDDEYYVEFNNLSRDYNPIFNYRNIVLPICQIILKEIE
jgi:hypothetical protein